MVTTPRPTTPSVWTLHNYVATFTAPGFGSLVANSFIYSAATAIVATIIGFGLSWLVVRTNTPAKGFAQPVFAQNEVLVATESNGLYEFAA